MNKLLTLFYCLPPERIVLIFALATFLYLKLWTLFHSRRWFHFGVGGVLICWLAAALWATVLNRAPGDFSGPELIPFHSYRNMIATGNWEISLANFMNTVLFYPAGLLLTSLFPQRWSPALRSAAVIVPFLLLSIGIEYSQFHWALGEPEVDDVIHNTLGAILGALPLLLTGLLPSRGTGEAP